MTETTSTLLRPSLELDALTFRFRRALGRGFGVGPVTGTLTPGIYHLRGENGSGKTTLMRLLCGELKPTSGRCAFRGMDLWRDHVARRHVGYLPTRPDQPDFLTVRECWRFHAAMRVAPEWDGAALCDALDLDPSMQLAHTSSGQRRRAELIAALAGDPAVLLLDEVFTTLDEQGVSVLTSLLEGWRADRIVLLTAHHELPVTADATWTLTAGEPINLTP